MSVIMNPWLLAVILMMLTVVSVKLIFCNSLLETLVMNSVFSLLIAVSYLLMDAPDVAMTEVALGACLSSCVFLSFLSRLDFFHNSTSIGNLHVDPVLESSRTSEYAAVLRSVSPTNSGAEASYERSLLKTTINCSIKPTRVISSSIICLIFIITFTLAGLDLPEYGATDSPVQNHISKYYIENTKNDIGIPSFVAALLASYRGYDTLGETAVILIAGISVLLLFSQKNIKNG